jgi:hypothetical protein
MFAGYNDINIANTASFANRESAIGYTSRKPSANTIRVFTRAIARFEKKGAISVTWSVTIVIKAVMLLVGEFFAKAF